MKWEVPNELSAYSLSSRNAPIRLLVSPSNKSSGIKPKSYRSRPGVDRTGSGRLGATKRNSCGAACIRRFEKRLFPLPRNTAVIERGPPRGSTSSRSGRIRNASGTVRLKSAAASLWLHWRLHSDRHFPMIDICSDDRRLCHCRTPLAVYRRFAKSSCQRCAARP